jgi:cytosine/adenosine deaminase-related metal-dependent hydrolase
MLFRARLVVPVAAPKIADGGIWVREGRIAAIGPWPAIRVQAAGDEVMDLGEVALFPGLVNAHAHLEYTGLAGKLSGSGGFASWVRSINAVKREQSAASITADWLSGADMLLRSGTTVVADMQTIAPEQPARLARTPLRVIPFIEMTGVISRRAPADLLAEADAVLERCGVAGGYSPHAPYSTMPDLLGETARHAAIYQRPIAIHVAESDEERTMFGQRNGALFELISQLGRPMDDCDGRTPVQHLAKLGLLGARTLAVHANYLIAEDIDLLAQSGTNVVHCPSSHDFFAHRPFAYEELKRGGVNLCLGTDSLATQKAGSGLDMLGEMRRFQEKNSSVGPAEILQMATRNGARALNITGVTGDLEIGSFADFFTISYQGDAQHAEVALLDKDVRVTACYVAGQKAF